MPENITREPCPGHNPEDEHEPCQWVTSETDTLEWCWLQKDSDQN